MEGLLDVPEDLYHADEVGEVVPTLSASIAHVLVTDSPLHAWTIHPKLGAMPRPPTDAMDRGSLIHALLLAEGSEIVVVEERDWRKKAAQEQRDAARAEGKIPVLAHVYERLSNAVERIRASIAEFGFDLDDGTTEQTIIWDELAGRETVRCRGRLDKLWVGGGIGELKSCQRAHPEVCIRAMLDRGYVVQEAAYRSAIESIQPDLIGRVDFTFLFVESDEPYAVTPIQSSGAMREIGSQRWQRAVELWARCLKANRWPAYTDKILRAEPPAWVLAREMEDAT